MSFSYDIKAIRQKNLLSQEAFAQILGVSFTTVNRWETGKSKPSYKTMKLIDDYCKSNNIDFDISKELVKE
ncbi:MAG: helix-turn-helix domain-containing protein [Monoglobaceae bacterium]